MSYRIPTQWFLSGSSHWTIDFPISKQVLLSFLFIFNKIFGLEFCTPCSVQVETSTWCRFTHGAGLGSCFSQGAIYPRSRVGVLLPICIPKPMGGIGIRRLHEAKKQEISVPIGYSPPLPFRANLCIFTKAIVCPNACISMCLTWRRVLAPSCLEALVYIIYFCECITIIPSAQAGKIIAFLQPYSLPQSFRSI